MDTTTTLRIGKMGYLEIHPRAMSAFPSQLAAGSRPPHKMDIVA
jgi:hypothetical protein